MRILVIISLSLLFFSACKKEQTEVMEVMSSATDTSSVLKYQADFKNSSDVTTTGKAEVYLKNEAYLLKLLNFSTSGGPDLHVLLSKEELPVNYIDLGSLSKIKGDQEYVIPGAPNFSEYKYICIHCIQYNHLFGSAKIN